MVSPHWVRGIYGVVWDGCEDGKHVESWIVLCMGFCCTVFSSSDLV